MAFDTGVTAWFLDPNDAAISKYARLGSRDREWIRAGLQAGILSLLTIEYRLRETSMKTDERQRVKAALAQDRQWLDSPESAVAPADWETPLPQIGELGQQVHAAPEAAGTPRTVKKRLSRGMER